MYVFFKTTLCLSFLILGLHAQAQEEILGRWQDEDNATIIEIYEDNGIYAGRIVWLLDSLDLYSNKKLDVENDNSSLRSRPLIGTDLIYGFQYYENYWRKGKIYDFNSGRTYNGKIVVKEDELRLSGYYGVLSFLGRTTKWHRP